MSQPSRRSSLLLTSGNIGGHRQMQLHLMRECVRAGCWPNWIYHAGQPFNYQSAGSVGGLVLVSHV